MNTHLPFLPTLQDTSYFKKCNQLKHTHVDSYILEFRKTIVMTIISI